MRGATTKVVVLDRILSKVCKSATCLLITSTSRLQLQHSWHSRPWLVSTCFSIPLVGGVEECQYEDAWRLRILLFRFIFPRTLDIFITFASSYHIEYLDFIDRLRKSFGFTIREISNPPEFTNFIPIKQPQKPAAFTYHRPNDEMEHDTKTRKLNSALSYLETNIDSAIKHL